MIRTVQRDDAEAIASIYNHYITHTTVTFEEEAVDAAEIQTRIANIQAENLPYLVAEDSSGKVIGYAYAGKWRERYSYRFSVEVTVYLSAEHSGQGVGSKLYEALFAALKAKSIHVAIGGITLPNNASIALHEKFGMQKAAHFKEVGFKFNQWLDVGYWQVTL